MPILMRDFRRASTHRFWDGSIRRNCRESGGSLSLFDSGKGDDRAAVKQDQEVSAIGGNRSRLRLGHGLP
ncbi:hypothetical protein NOCARDAX2BIS_520132 [Nocardioides sp. AX2bis]|nr:hypothetical protein NOCARDAX2BIS_520132 [Nocardioides sp. AX2bis]